MICRVPVLIVWVALFAACQLFDGSVPCSAAADCAEGACLDGFCALGAPADGGASGIADSGPVDSGDDDDDAGPPVTVDSGPDEADAGPSPIDAGAQRDAERGSACEPAAPLVSCAPGLVCTPFGECQETCAVELCSGNANFCVSDTPTYVCNEGEASHCVNGGGLLRLCREVDVDFDTGHCTQDSSVLQVIKGVDDLPTTACTANKLQFLTSHFCIAGVQEGTVEQVGSSLEVFTSEPLGYNPPTCSPAGILQQIELSALRSVGGDLRVLPGSSTTEPSPFRELELPALHSVYGTVRYESSPDVERLAFDDLEVVGGFVVLRDLPALQTVYLPALREIHGGLYVDDVPALHTLSLENILLIDGYVRIDAPCVDESTLAHLAAVATGPVDLVNTGTEVCP